MSKIKQLRPMLAYQETPDLNALKYDVMASPKMDGVRALIVDGQLKSRKLKDFGNKHVNQLLGNPLLNGLDGELVYGSPTANNCLQATMSAVASHDGKPEVMLYVFDDFTNPDLPFAERIKRVEERAFELGDRFPLVVVQHRLIHSPVELLSYEESALGIGYEGLILRSLSGPYKFGRSTANEGYMMKLKPWADSEAVILKVLEGTHNLNEAKTNALGLTERSTSKANKIGTGTAGSLLLRDVKTGVEFQCSLRDQAEKDWYWVNQKTVLGKVVKYKYFAATGVKDKPRFPGLLSAPENPKVVAVREDFDLVDFYAHLLVQGS